MSDDTTSETGRGFGRRSVLLGAGGLVLGTGAAGATTVLADEDRRTDDDDDRSGPLPIRFQDAFRSEAFVLDTDMDGRLANTTRLAGDPGDEGRDRVVHVTSRGKRTGDYVVAGVDLRDWSLSVHEASEAGIAYDYYEGSDATNRVPDELMVLLRTGTTDFAVAVRGETADGTGTWETRDISSELTAGGWRAVEMDLRRLDFGAVRRVATAGDVDDVETLLRELSVGKEMETVSDLTARFGDASMLAMGIGNGALDGAVTDAYYDDLRIGGESEAIPAVIPMDASFDGPQGRGGGRVTATLSLPVEQAGLTAADVDPETVRMAPYASVAPPVPVVGRQAAVAPDAVGDVSADSVELEFVPGRVQRLASRSESQRVVVYGDFEGDEPYTFVAVGAVDGPGRGH